MGVTFRLLLVAFVVLLVGCTPGSRTTHGPCPDRPSPPLASGVFVEPDDGREPILDELAAARCTVDVSVYLLSDDDVMDALGDAAERRVRVRVILEEHPFGGGGSQDEIAAELRADGIDVRWSGRDVRFSHAKFAVVDRDTALIMNQNLTNSSFTGNREFGLISTEPAIVGQAQAIFDADWGATDSSEITGPLIVSPIDSRTRLLALIAGARVSIDLYAEVIRDDGVVQALGDAAARGVGVRLILNDHLDENDQDIAATLSRRGVEIRLASHVYIHAKVMILDESAAVIGSQNFTATSLDDNREVAMVIRDRPGVVRCLAVFERDWLRSIPGAAVNRSPWDDRIDMARSRVYSVRTVPEGWATHMIDLVGGAS